VMFCLLVAFDEVNERVQINFNLQNESHLNHSDCSYRMCIKADKLLVLQLLERLKVDSLLQEIR
jgi:hypothetical protein